MVLKWAVRAGFTWPCAALAQEGERMRRVGVLWQGQENRSQPAGLAAFREELAKLGWIEGRNLRTDLRFGTDLDSMRAHAAELVSFNPDVIFTSGRQVTRPVQRETRTIPIVFVTGANVENGDFVGNISRPEGNATGIGYRYLSEAGKWLQFLKDAVPRLARVAVIFNPDFNISMRERGGYRVSIEGAATALGVQPIWMAYHTAAELERGITAFAAEPNSGLILTPANDAVRESVYRLVAQNRLPAIYTSSNFVKEGGLMSYATRNIDIVRQSASYVDRILRGAKPSDLPVQFPTKYELVINLKAAKAIGLEIPATLLGLADEVIE
jgi:putative ABC transport system substrate-binding protein